MTLDQILQTYTPALLSAFISLVGVYLIYLQAVVRARADTAEERAAVSLQSNRLGLEQREIDLKREQWQLAIQQELMQERTRNADKINKLTEQRISDAETMSQLRLQIANGRAGHDALILEHQTLKMQYSAEITRLNDKLEELTNRVNELQEAYTTERKARQEIEAERNTIADRLREMQMANALLTEENEALSKKIAELTKRLEKIEQTQEQDDEPTTE